MSNTWRFPFVSYVIILYKVVSVQPFVKKLKIFVEAMLINVLLLERKLLFLNKIVMRTFIFNCHSIYHSPINNINENISGDTP